MGASLLTSQATTTLSEAEQRALRTFRQYLVTPGQMLCFYGPDLEKHKAALQRLTDRQLLVKERFKGGFSLTEAGYQAMKACTLKNNGNGASKSKKNGK